MTDENLHHVLEFKMRDAFPASSPTARWLAVCCMAMNDLLFVNRELISRLQGDAPEWENLYLARLAASHLYEASKFLTQAERRYGPDLQPFLARLPQEAVNDYELVKAVGPAGAGDFAKRLERLRNHFFHYAQMIPQAPLYEELSKALDVHADLETSIRVGDQLGEFRAVFADEVAAALTYDGVEAFVAEFAETSAAFWRFVYAALQQHLLDAGLVTE